MPIYEYQCENCNHSLEIIQKADDPPPSDCPSCELPKLRKKLSAVAFRLAGGGWYETDFKTGDKKNLVGDAEKNVKPTSENKKSDEAKSNGNSGKTETKTNKNTGKGSKGEGASSAS